MGRSHAGRGALLSSNLPQLQNLIKRDPQAYKEEFLQQWNHYKSTLNIFRTNPDEQSEQFRDMITFISQVQCRSKSLRGEASHRNSRSHHASQRKRPSSPLSFRLYFLTIMEHLIWIRRSVSSQTSSFFERKTFFRLQSTLVLSFSSAYC